MRTLLRKFKTNYLHQLAGNKLNNRMRGAVYIYAWKLILKQPHISLYHKNILYSIGNICVIENNRLVQTRVNFQCQTGDQSKIIVNVNL